MLPAFRVRCFAAALAAGLWLLGGCGGESGAHGDDEDGAEPARAGVTQVITAENLPPPAPKPQQPMSFDQTCVTAECHGQFLVRRVTHAPVAGGRCDTCHGPDSGDHTFPLKASVNETCAFCHAVGGKEAHQHEPLTEPGCTSCHDPHVSDTKFLLTRSSVGQLCRECHDLPLDKFAHASYADGQCTVCHAPHESPNRLLLRGGEGNDFCFSCHEDLGRQFDEWHQFVHKPAQGECSECHSAHTSPAPFLLQKPVKQHCAECHPKVVAMVDDAEHTHGAMDGRRSCTNCHSPHASVQKALLEAREDVLCLKCHTEAIEKDDGRTVAAMGPVLQRDVLHGPLTSGNCSACHDTHGAAHPNLLREPFPDAFYTPFELDKYSLCFRCHSADLVRLEQTDKLTGFRDGERNLHYVHVHREEKGRTCRSCHAVHASDNPLHVAESVPFAGSNWQMPIRFEKTDDGGRCAPGCHEPMSYQRGVPQDAPPN